MKHLENVSPNSSPCLTPLTAAALLCTFAAALPGQNLVQNGSFESPVINQTFVQVAVPNWTATIVGTGAASNAEVLRKLLPTDWGATAGYTGDQWLELDALANVAIFQDVPTTAGQNYRLTFKYANRPGVPVSAIVVRWNGVQVGSTVSTTSSTFQTATITNLVAAGATSRLTLEAAGAADQQGDWIDDVILVSEAAIPAPTLTSFTTTPTAALAGQPFIFNAQGTNFDPASVQVLISGPGCTPCTVANAQLVTKTATTLQGSTLLATAGDYTVTVQNGSGPQSATQPLRVSTPGPVIPNSLTFNYSGGALPPAQTLTLSSPGGGSTQSTYIIDFPTATWLSVTPRGPAVVSASSPATITVTATPTGLLPGTYNSVLNVRFDAAIVNVPVTLVVQGVVGGGGNTNQVLSHIADSAGWQTSIILVNHDADPSPYSLRFYGSQTTNKAASLPLEMSFAGLAGRSTLVEGIIPAGGTRTITTAGTDSSLNMGWAELVTSKNIQGSSIFRDTAGRQEAAVGLTTGVRAFLLPFDNSQGRVTAFALINTNPSQPVTVTATVRDENGILLGSPVTIALLPRGHVATETTVQFPGSNNQRGSVEFSTANPDITGLGIRFDAPPTTPGAPRPFTSLPVQPRR